MSRAARLGCLPHDPDKAARLRAMRYGTQMPPASLPRAEWQPCLWDNDTLPNCTAVSLGHAARAWCRRIEGPGNDMSIAAPFIDRLYAEAIGQPGATLAQLAATEGADPLAVVETAQTSGFDVGGQVRLVPDFAILPTARTEMANGIARCGSVMLALTLYAADMDAAAAGKPWVPGGDPGPAVGGHMVAAVSYDGLQDTENVQIATWGNWKSASWEWVLARLRLALVTGWRQLVPPAQYAAYDALWGAKIA